MEKAEAEGARVGVMVEELSGLEAEKVVGKSSSDELVGKSSNDEAKEALINEGTELIVALEAAGLASEGIDALLKGNSELANALLQQVAVIGGQDAEAFADAKADRVSGDFEVDPALSTNEHFKVYCLLILGSSLVHHCITVGDRSDSVPVCSS